MAKAHKPEYITSGGIWSPQGGTSRNFINRDTGEIISRRQFDKRYGALAKGGFKSYETKAAASPEAARRARPAFNRPSQVSSNRKLSSLNPLTEKQSRDYAVGLSGIYNGNVAEFHADIESFRREYTEILDNLRKNKKIIAIAVTVSGSNATGSHFTKTVFRLVVPKFAPDFNRFRADLLEQLYEGDVFTSISFHIRFYEKYIPRSKRKQEIKRIRQLKSKREDVKKRTRK